jgi:beta-glucosidase-like glycosyl hydrolase
MSSNQYRRDLQRKRDSQAAAERKASEARQKEAAKRIEATKARASAERASSDSSRRSRLRDAQRHEKAANDAGKDVGHWQAKAAGYTKESGSSGNGVQVGVRTVELGSP